MAKVIMVKADIIIILSFQILLCGAVISAAVVNPTDDKSETDLIVPSSETQSTLPLPRSPRSVSMISQLLTTFAFRMMFFRVVRVFAEYFTDLMLGELIGARNLDAKDGSTQSRFQWLMSLLKTEQSPK